MDGDERCKGHTTGIVGKGAKFARTLIRITSLKILRERFDTESETHLEIDVTAMPTSRKSHSEHRYHRCVMMGMMVATTKAGTQ